jgi:hypothetical protein
MDLTHKHNNTNLFQIFAHQDMTETPPVKPNRAFSQNKQIWHRPLEQESLEESENEGNNT